MCTLTLRARADTCASARACMHVRARAGCVRASVCARLHSHIHARARARQLKSVCARARERVRMQIGRARAQSAEAPHVDFRALLTWRSGGNQRKEKPKKNLTQFLGVPLERRFQGPRLWKLKARDFANWTACRGPSLLCRGFPLLFFSPLPLTASPILFSLIRHTSVSNQMYFQLCM